MSGQVKKKKKGPRLSVPNYFNQFLKQNDPFAGAFIEQEFSSLVVYYIDVLIR